jgi:type II secretory pathway predicted ATPase ExeA
MEHYLTHHVIITGVPNSLFENTAVTAVHQGSGGLFRKANNLARGALIAAANEPFTTVPADQLRLAATEIFRQSNGRASSQTFRPVKTI